MKVNSSSLQIDRNSGTTKQRPEPALRYIHPGRVYDYSYSSDAAEFHRVKAPIYTILGNHEYFGNIEKAGTFFREAGILLLKDSVAHFKGLDIIGRNDRTSPNRKNLQELIAGLGGFTILLDHQPYQLEEAEEAGIDFQFSGHTHRGQVWPLSWVTDWVYEKSWGHHRRGHTQYYISSGLGIWGPKIRIGTRSEYLVVHITNQHR